MTCSYLPNLFCYLSFLSMICIIVFTPNEVVMLSCIVLLTPFHTIVFLFSLLIFCWWVNIFYYTIFWLCNFFLILCVHHREHKVFYFNKEILLTYQEKKNYTIVWSRSQRLTLVKTIKRKNYVNRRLQLKTTMVYPTTSSSGWGQLPIGFTGYKEAQRTLL